MQVEANNNYLRSLFNKAMKKSLIISFLVLSVLLGKAQTKTAIRGGVNYNTGRVYYDTEKQPTGYKAGGNLGVQLDAPFDEGLHFTPYIGYNLKGFTTSPKTGSITKIDNTIHYIDVVPKLSYYFSNDKDASFVIGAGISLGTAIAGTEKITKDGVTTKQKMNFDISKDYGFFDFGFIPSIGYTTKKFFIETAFQLGLTSINNNEEKDLKNIRNRTLSLNFGYFFKQKQ